VPQIQLLFGARAEMSDTLQLVVVVPQIQLLSATRAYNSLLVYGTFGSCS